MSVKGGDEDEDQPPSPKVRAKRPARAGAGKRKGAAATEEDVQEAEVKSEDDVKDGIIDTKQNPKVGSEGDIKPELESSAAAAAVIDDVKDEPGEFCSEVFFCLWEYESFVHAFPTVFNSLNVDTFISTPDHPFCFSESTRVRT